MGKYIMAVLALALIALGLSAFELLPVSDMIPQIGVAFGLILVLLNLIIESDRKRL